MTDQCQFTSLRWDTVWSILRSHHDHLNSLLRQTVQVSPSCSPLTCFSFRSALQILHKACEVSRRYNYFPGGMALTWMGYYESCISSEQSCINEWNAMQDLETLRPDSPAIFVDKWVQTLKAQCLWPTSRFKLIFWFVFLEVSFFSLFLISWPTESKSQTYLLSQLNLIFDLFNNQRSSAGTVYNLLLKGKCDT